MLCSILGVYPVGEVQLDTHTKVDSDLLPYKYGVYKVTVLPPRKPIFHPILPLRHDGKVCFMPIITVLGLRAV